MSYAYSWSRAPSSCWGLQLLVWTWYGKLLQSPRLSQIFTLLGFKLGRISELALLQQHQQFAFTAHVLLSNNLGCQPYISFCLFSVIRYSHRASNGDKKTFSSISIERHIDVIIVMDGGCEDCIESTLPVFRSYLTTGETQSILSIDKCSLALSWQRH